MKYALQGAVFVVNYKNNFLMQFLMKSSIFVPKSDILKLF